MNKILYILFIPAILLCRSTTAIAQVSPDIRSAFDIYQQNRPQEKIFVQTDKDFYLTGELIWFKMYTINAQTNLPADLSKVAYVDVLDKNNNSLLQAKVALKKGTGSGSFYIPVTAMNGNYKLRGYTSLMKNYGPDFFFEKPITIVNPLSDPAPHKITKAEVDLQFFPEGGDLVEGMHSKIGFKVTGSDGLGKVFAGVVVNQRNDTVARFRTLKFGIGQFDFTPAINSSYKAIGRTTQGEIVIRELPVTRKQGAVLSVTSGEAGKLNIQIASNLQDPQVYLFIHSGKKIIAAEKLQINNKQTSYTIDLQKLGEGINHITLFNVNGQPVAERLYFKKPLQKLNILASLNAGSFQARQKVDLELFATNESGAALSADLALSVYKLDSLQGKDPADIVSYLWLRSELHGNIEDPNYYLQNNTAESTEALDNLLLTQGWRRFLWSEVLSGKPAPLRFLPEYNGHLIEGKIVDKNGTNAANTVVYAGMPGKRIQFYSALSDSSGRFLFNTKDLYGQNELIVQTNYERDSLYKINITQPFSEQYSKQELPLFNVASALAESLRAQSISTQVQNIYNGSKFKQFYYPGIDSTAYFGSVAKTYKLSDYVRFTTMEEVFREYVREAFVSRRQKHFHIKVMTATTLLEDDPLVLLDGVPYFNLDRVFAIDPLKIEKMNIVNTKYYYGPAISEGIISLQTYKGDLGGTEIDPHAIILDYEGMQLQREFYAPVYNSELLKNSRLPDFRNVLYWSPSVPIDEKGKGKINFYTSDLSGSYLGIIQGISAQGIPGIRYFSFDVK
ncbi:hypothetical protein [Pedobacter duraquae]|uniref:MG2 domain-containing protein n=1 Tax=Pedobacter duraquae TaxID=425511 RepID=A0A4R6IR99_9SPHI|nr:hypothetical protein [Pedobacter duraquae]TDO24425.1 hypothetical protein CLV32_0714 [Pedobacter duraquae]